MTTTTTESPRPATTLDDLRHELADARGEARELRGAVEDLGASISTLTAMVDTLLAAAGASAGMTATKRACRGSKATSKG